MVRATVLFLIWMLALPAPAATARMGVATVELSMGADAAYADVRLDRSVTSFAFGAADVVRKQDFELLTAGLSFNEEQVTGSKPFRAFRMRIVPMKGERDAKYPAHFRIGTGGVVYAPALLGDPRTWQTRLRFRTAPGEVRMPARGDVSKGYVFIGPRTLLTADGGATVIADPATPPWLVERSRTALTAAVAEYTETLGLKLRRKPLLIVRHQPGERNFNVGDVTPGAVTALRFHGAAWEKPDAQAGRTIERFMLHEVFHFWNGDLASFAEGTPAWLHEGGAEYAALLAGLRRGLMTEEEVTRALGDALNACRSGLQNTGNKSLASFSFLPAQLRYPCGMTIQWATDLHIRAASGGKETVLDAWRKIIAGAQGKARGYTLADFNAAAGVPVGRPLPPVALLVEQSGARRWAELAGALNGLGAEVVEAPSATGRRAALLFHVLRNNCLDLPQGAGYGFFINGRTLKLQAPAGCRILAGDPVIASIEGGDPFDVTEVTYAAVQRRCAAKEPVTFVTADGRSLAAACTTPLAPAPQDYQVRRWRPQAASR